MTNKMASKIFSSLVRQIGIDLGSDRVRLWTDRDGLVLDEASVLALESGSRKIIAVGDDAEEMTGRVGQNVQLIRPVVDGRITDLQFAQMMIKSLLQRVVKSAPLLSPSMMISTPVGSTTADRLVATRLLYNLGARDAYTIAQPLASSIGAGVPIADASGCFLLQLGSGVTEAVVVSLGSVVGRQSTHYAGNYMIHRLQYAIKKEYGLFISLASTKKVLSQLISLDGQERSEPLTGKDIKTERPKEVVVKNSALLPVVYQIIARYENLLKQMLSQVPPELTVDVIDKGLLLSGGVSQLEGLAAYLTARMGVPVSVVDEPDKSVIFGIATAMEHLTLFKESLAYQYSA